jgi:hypothetical protein
MIIALWITALLLTALYLLSGGMKVATAGVPDGTYSDLVDDLGVTGVRTIGVVEVIGALGILLPLVTGIAPILIVLAGIGLVLVQLGAGIYHLRKGDAKVLGVNVALLLLAVAVTVLALLR